ncbi:MAG: hypothetical protein MZU79_00395 [Anaerotruncus sp.]|nr:hypothetical protein [Anaerotruncus sp.]
MNTKIRDWMPRQAAECDSALPAEVRQGPGRGLHGRQVPADAHRDVQRRHHPRRVPGRRHRPPAEPARATIGCFPWRFVDGESQHRAHRGHGGGRPLREADGQEGQVRADQASATSPGPRPPGSTRKPASVDPSRRVFRGIEPAKGRCADLPARRDYARTVGGRARPRPDPRSRGSLLHDDAGRPGGRGREGGGSRNRG